MTFEEKIIKNSKIRQKNLMRPAKIAFENPDTGVTINKKGAYFLIKDSADITVKYLSHLSYASYSNPISDLKGKFTQSEIIDFVGRAKEENFTNQLLSIILTDIGVTTPVAQVVTETASEEIDLSFDDDEDVYGDYETDESEQEESSAVPQESIDIKDASIVIQKLIEVFEAK